MVRTVEQKKVTKMLKLLFDEIVGENYNAYVMDGEDAAEAPTPKQIKDNIYYRIMNDPYPSSCVSMFCLMGNEAHFVGKEYVLSEIERLYAKDGDAAVLEEYRLRAIGGNVNE